MAELHVGRSARPGVEPHAPAPARRRRLVALVAAGLLCLLAVMIAEDWAAGSAERERFESGVAALDSGIAAALAAGFTEDDLGDILTARAGLTGRPEPVWVGNLYGHYHRQAASAGALLTQLERLQERLLAQERDAAAARLKEAEAQIAEDQRLGADEGEIAALRARYDAAVQAAAKASGITQLRQATRDADAAATAAADAATAQRAETAAIQEAVPAVKQEAGGDIGRLRARGRAALAGGRNDAVVATWLRVPAVDIPYRRLEKQAAGLGGGDVDGVAFAVAGVLRYGGQIHDALIRGMPPKAIVMSMSGQELWAFENGRVVLDTLVTSGRPELPTDVGPMKVLRKDSPWRMHSPWPPGSPWWYPDTVVQMVVWFTVTGEGFHDASWQYGPYGPGTQYGPDASHGCVHVPWNAERFLYDWADVGIPAILYPGDGGSLADQVAQKTTTDEGVPYSALPAGD